MKKHILKKSLSLLLSLLLIISITGVTVAGVEAETGILYVKHDATGAKDGSSWQDAFTILQDALDVVVSGQQIRVAAGTYYPTSTYELDPSDPRNRHFR